MKVIIYGATGMVGRAALLECLEDTTIEAVLTVGRRPTEESHTKLSELVLDDFLDYTKVSDQIAGYDACLYCLGISSVGVSEDQYRRVTHDFTIAAGEALVAANPEMRMCFVTADGTSAESKIMWARVKAAAENALLAMSWRSAHMFRPAGILPQKGVKSRVRSYRVLYSLFGWTYPLAKKLAPNKVTTSVHLARALIHVARHGHELSILEGRDINAVLTSE